MLREAIAPGGLVQHDDDLSDDECAKERFGDIEYTDSKLIEIEHLHGADEEKGAVAVVSDRFAVSGKKSLAIHDIPGLEAGWQPLVRFDVQSNLGGPVLPAPR